MEVEYIRYKYGMINKPSQRKKLKKIYLEKGNIPTEIIKLIEEKEIFSIKGTLGNKDGAIPIEYEEVKIKADGKETKFEIYNKGVIRGQSKNSEVNSD